MFIPCSYYSKQKFIFHEKTPPPPRSIATFPAKLKLSIAGFFLALISLTWVNCTREQNFVNQDLVNKYYNALTPALSNSYDYLTNAITKNEPLSKKNFSEIVSTNLQGKTLPSTPLSATPSESFKATCKNLIKALEADQLKTHEDFLAFGEQQLKAIKDESEKENAAMVIAAANLISNYVATNADKLQNLILNPNLRNYFDAKTGMLIFQTRAVVKTIKVIGAVVAGVIGFVVGITEEVKDCSTWQLFCRVSNGLKKGYEYGSAVYGIGKQVDRILDNLWT